MTTTTTTQDLTGTYALDASHTRIGFAARHAMVTTVRGQFTELEGLAHLDGADPSRSTATVVIKTASLDTGNADRDAHVRGADFLDVDTYPEIRFVSTSAEQVDEQTYRMSGDLTIKDVTRPVTVDFTYVGAVQDPWGNTRIGFEGSTKVSRKDWGLTWNVALEAGGILVSDKVTLEFDLSAVKQP
ncbi:MAG: YceI family protein [Actinomycetota bacterium]|nr:YceI family protein [Actinomycetota bacterium]